MDRIRMKAMAREALQKHYWKCVLVSFVFYIATVAAVYFISYGIGFGFGYGSSFGIAMIAILFEEGTSYMEPLYAFGIVTVIFLAMGLCLTATGVAGKAFLVNPIEIGCKKFACNSLNSEEAKLGDMGSGFHSNYKNIAKIMFVRDLYIGLWLVLWMGIYMILGMTILMGGVYLSKSVENIFSETVMAFWMILLVLLVYIICILCYIPIYIKMLQYMFIPYILAENPSMDRKQAFALSKQMMQGNKWDMFVMHLSFLGWFILGGCTCYILHFLYVAPYIEYTTAAYYKALKQKIEMQQEIIL